jgi:hypothetical protein
MRVLPFPTLLDDDLSHDDLSHGELSCRQDFSCNTMALLQSFRPWLESPWTLLACKLIIGLVSAYDIFLTIKYVNSLPLMELNPIGRWMMQLDSGPECGLDQIACFVAAKFSGNFLTLACIELLCHWRRSLACLVACGVSAAQLLLLYFLMHG